MRRLVSVAGALVVVAAGGYATADVYDLVPGVLTRDEPVRLHPPTPGQTGPTVALPVPAAATLPLTSTESAPSPRAGALKRAMDHFLTDPALGASVGVSITDALTGATLLTQQANTPRMVASTQKLLTAAAIVSTMDQSATMRTKVVQGATPRDIVLVAGGDTMLGRGAGHPVATPGRAGLGDLAGQVAGALRATGTTKVTLRLDLSYAAGPAYPSTWAMADVYAGATQGVHMIGLSDERPRIGHASPSDPAASVAAVFAKDLSAAGVTVTLARRATWATPAKPDAPVLGSVSSAPLRDVLVTALDESDNALTENLARQGAVAQGHPATFAGATAFVMAALKALKVDTTGISLRDTSGLTRSQRVPVRAIAAVLTLGTTGKLPGLQDAVARLSVAGLTGTLADRFQLGKARFVRGVPRSKTGTLIGSSGLAGTTVDADGRLLSYVVVADHVPPSQGTLAARAALDRFVAALTTCGCR